MHTNIHAYLVYGHTVLTYIPANLHRYTLHTCILRRFDTSTKVYRQNKDVYIRCLYTPSVYADTTQEKNACIWLAYLQHLRVFLVCILHVCMRKCMYLEMYAWLYACTNARIMHTHICIHNICTYIYTHYMYVDGYVYIYICYPPSRIYRFHVFESRMRNSGYSITYAALFINSSLNKLRFDQGFRRS